MVSFGSFKKLVSPSIGLNHKLNEAPLFDVGGNVNLGSPSHSSSFTSNLE